MDRYIPAPSWIKDSDDVEARLAARDAERTRTTLVSVWVGAIVGWAIGMGQLIFVGSWEFFYWTWMPMIPIYSALGWALFGMIVGESGLFMKSAAPRVKPRAACKAKLHSALHN